MVLKLACKDCLSTTRKLSKPGPRCITCWRASQKLSRARTADKRLSVTYGVGPGFYEAQLALQGGVCAIPGCGRKPPLRKRFAVDHDHACCPGPTSCGKCVRGLVCKRENTVMGWYHDDPAIFDGLAWYLRNGGVINAEPPH